MKQFLIIVLGCIVAIHSKAQDNTNVLINDVMVMAKDDTTTIEGSNLGTLKFRDKVFTSNCSWFEVISNLVSKTKEKGGNLIKILSVKQPDGWSSCYRITADAYKVSDPRKYERQIQWSAARKLAISDFKGTPNPLYKDEVAGLTYSGFGFQTNRVTLFKAAKFYIYCRFYCTESWIKEKYASDERVLKHEQAHFDITEIYARKLLKALTEENLNVYNLQRANDIYQKLAEEYKEYEKQYDDETAHGTDAAQQQKWYQVIANQLAALAGYARDEQSNVLAP